jgi:predicted nucleic acid-binding protein
MKILIDTNILLDIALTRTEFLADSTAVMDWAELNPKQASVAWHSISNLAYIVKQDVREFIADLLVFVEVAAGDTSTVRQALAMPTKDLEDALQASAAITFRADVIVTRNVADFRKLPIKAMTPAQFARTYMPDPRTDDDEQV